MVVAKMWSRNIDYYLRDNEENQETIPVMMLKQQYPISNLINVSAV